MITTVNVDIEDAAQLIGKHTREEPAKAVDSIPHASKEKAYNTHEKQGRSEQ